MANNIPADVTIIATTLWVPPALGYMFFFVKTKGKQMVAFTKGEMEAAERQVAWPLDLPKLVVLLCFIHVQVELD